MTEAPQKATVKDTVSQISRALNGGARMILEQPFGSDYIPNKHALDAWNRRADLPAAVTGWREEILRHLDLSQNHEAGLIPMATQVLLQKIADAATTQPDPVKDAPFDIQRYLKDALFDILKQTNLPENAAYGGVAVGGGEYAWVEFRVEKAGYRPRALTEQEQSG